VAFDTFYGWPNDGSLNDNAQPKDGESIVAGMAVKKDADGLLVKADGTAGENVWWAVNDQSAFDVESSASLPIIAKNAIILTDQFEAGDYTENKKVQVSTTSPGLVAPVAAGIVVGTSDGRINRDGIEYLKIILA